jgi:ABC-type sugar transport system ATPase subunit
LRTVESSKHADNVSDTPLTVANATFFIESLKDEPVCPSSGNNNFLFSVSRFDFSVAKGEVVGICGPVGGELRWLCQATSACLVSYTDSFAE